MTLDLPVTERRLKSTARLMHQSMWLLFAVAAGLMVVVRRSGMVRTGSIWMLGCAVLAFMLSFALRDMVRKVVRRNTEDKLVKDVKNYLQKEPVGPVVQAAPARTAASGPDEEFVPGRANDFLRLKEIAPRGQGADLVVFDAIPARESTSVRLDFYPVLLPVRAC